MLAVNRHDSFPDPPLDITCERYNIGTCSPTRLGGSKYVSTLFDRAIFLAVAEMFMPSLLRERVSGDGTHYLYLSI